MYSKAVQSVLKRKGIRIGDRVIVEKAGKAYEGLLMPRIEMGDAGTLVIKLDSGYNMGVSSKGMKIRKGRGRTPGAVRAEEELELGKIRKDLTKVKFSAKKPKVSLVAVGGTMASRVDYKTGGVEALMDPKEFLHNVPELANVVNISRISQPLKKMSEDLDHTDWQLLAKEVAKELNSGARGVVVTHGTDTMHFTSAALSFMLRDLGKPVVLTGAQRSSDRGSSDAGMNLICSAHAAVSDIAEVGVCMHANMDDDYCLLSRGTKVRKMHTSRRDAFRPINEPPLAMVWPSGKISRIGEARKRSDGKVKVDAKFEHRVALLKVFPGSDPGIVDFYLSRGYRGLVIEGTGLGHVPTQARKSWIPAISKAVKAGVPVVVTSQTIYGRVNPSVYANLRELFHKTGAIPGEDMLPETAYVKLGWVLAKTRDMEKVREMMLTNYAGEITARSEPEGFLY